jgi:hypothetical protein
MRIRSSASSSSRSYFTRSSTSFNLGGYRFGLKSQFAPARHGLRTPMNRS